MTDLRSLDPDLAAALPALPVLDLDHVSVARSKIDALLATRRTNVSYDGVGLDIVTAPGIGDDPDVAIRLITPADARGPVPVLVWFHGGGFVVGTAQSSDSYCIEIVRRLRIAVANVDYRLAPENPYPGPMNDCYAALCHLYDRAESYGLDASRIAVGGQSAGAGLAAGTVLRARDERSVPVAFQLLEIPALDDRLSTRSMIDFVDTPMWNRVNAVLSWRHYLGSDYRGPSDPNVPIYAAPGRAEDLTDLPPAYLSAMELDPLRDEGIEYGLKMLRAGVSVELHSFPGAFHGCGIIPHAEVSKRAHSESLYALTKGLGLP